jgi:biopolymer transport protein ExbB
MSGQGTLDKVAGPVGEALIMTALGLAVAIPAVLAYNAFQRRNRIWLNRWAGTNCMRRVHTLDATRTHCMRQA